MTEKFQEIENIIINLTRKEIKLIDFKDYEDYNEIVNDIYYVCDIDKINHELAEHYCEAGIDTLGITLLRSFISKDFFTEFLYTNLEPLLKEIIADEIIRYKKMLPEEIRKYFKKGKYDAFCLYLNMLTPKSHFVQPEEFMNKYRLENNVV